MMRRIAIVLLVPFFVSGVLADQVTLKNGDRISGKIQKKDGANLTVKTDLFGVVTIPWEAITQVSSEDPLTVVLPNGKSVMGKIATADSQLEVAAPTGKEAIPIASVTVIRNAEEQKAYERLEHPGLAHLWAGYADLGVSLARGNSVTNTVTAAVIATRETRAGKTSLYFNQIYAKGTNANGVSSLTADAVRGGWAYNKNVSARLFVNLFNDYEVDQFQNLDLRVVLGGGLGFMAVKNDRSRLDLLAGGAYNHEKFGASVLPASRNSGEFYWGDNYAFKISKITSLTQSFRMFNNLSHTGEYRMNFDAGTATRLWKFLAFQLTFTDRYRSDPVPGYKKNDVLFTAGLRFNFAKQ